MIASIAKDLRLGNPFTFVVCFVVGVVCGMVLVVCLSFTPKIVLGNWSEHGGQFM